MYVKAIEQMALLWDQANVSGLRIVFDRIFLDQNKRSPLANHPYSKLPELCCRAAGGDPTLAEGVTSAWNSLYFAPYLLDGVADGDAPACDSGERVTLAAACISSANLLLMTGSQPDISTSVFQAIQKDFQRTVLIACNGQVNDLTLSTPTLEQCWQVTREKTGEFYALACRSGARVATEDQKCILSFSDFGLHLGMLVQIGDDMNGLWSENDHPSDLFNGKWTLPVAYAMEVSPESKQRQLQQYLRAMKVEPLAEEKALEIIIESGAMLYLVAKANWHCSRAEKSIRRAAQPGNERDKLLELLARTVPRRGL